MIKMPNAADEWVDSFSRTRTLARLVFGLYFLPFSPLVLYSRAVICGTGGGSALGDGGGTWGGMSGVCLYFFKRMRCSAMFGMDKPARKKNKNRSRDTHTHTRKHATLSKEAIEE